MIITRMALPSIAFTQFQNAHGPYFSTQAHVGSQGYNILFVPLLITMLYTCTTIFPPPPMLLLLMSFMGPSFLVTNSVCSMFGYVQCTSLIPKYQMVKSSPAGNQSPGVRYLLGILLLIPVTSLWSWNLPQGIFTLSITWCSMTPSAPFSLYLMMKTPQYSETKFPFTHLLIKSHWKLGISL